MGSALTLITFIAEGGLLKCCQLLERNLFSTPLSTQKD